MFRIVISKLESVLQRGNQLGSFEGNTVVSPDDYTECIYLLETMHNTLGALTHNGWVSLLTQTMVQHHRWHDASTSEGQLTAIALEYPLNHQK